MAIQIEYWGHSCFRILCDGHSVVLDPYPAEMAGYTGAAPAAGLVLCSHEHFDHNCREAVALINEEGVSPFVVTTVDTWHDDAQGEKRGANKVHIIEAEEKRLVHCGDLGHPLSGEQLAEIGPVDVLMVPVGGFFTIDGVQAADLCRALQPRVILPMHYREGRFGFEQISEISVFLENVAEIPVICSEKKKYELTDAEGPVIIKLALEEK